MATCMCFPEGLEDIPLTSQIAEVQIVIENNQNSILNIISL